MLPLMGEMPCTSCIPSHGFAAYETLVGGDEANSVRLSLLYRGVKYLLRVKPSKAGSSAIARSSSTKIRLALTAEQPFQLLRLQAGGYARHSQALLRLLSALAFGLP
jgi:hypothetical protein